MRVCICVTKLAFKFCTQPQQLRLVTNGSMPWIYVPNYVQANWAMQWYFFVDRTCSTMPHNRYMPVTRWFVEPEPTRRPWKDVCGPYLLFFGFSCNISPYNILRSTWHLAYFCESGLSFVQLISVIILWYFIHSILAVSYTHLTLPTTPYV